MMNWRELPDHSRVWIYQCDRMLTEEEATAIRKKAEDFVADWSAHGTPLHASVDLIDRLFLLIMVDENQAMASGCSIDKSVAFVKALETEFGVSFMDRMKVAVETTSGLQLVHLHALPDWKAEGKINDQTLVYDNLVKNKKEFAERWKTPIAESWHHRFLQ